LSNKKFKILSFGMAMLIAGLMSAQFATAGITAYEFYTNVEAGRIVIPQDIYDRRLSTLIVHSVVGVFAILLAIVEVILIVKFWKT